MSGNRHERLSEVELRTDAGQPARQDAIRLEPRPTRNEPGVVGQDGAGVQHVVKIDSDSRPRATEPQDLREAKIELIEPIAVHRTGCDQIDGHVGHIPRRKPPERLRDYRGGHGIIRREQGTWLALLNAQRRLAHALRLPHERST